MKIEQIRNFHRFEKIRETWNKVLFSSDQNCIFLTHQWFYSWWKWLSEGKSLEIICSWNDEGRPIGIAPLMKEKNSLAFIASQEVSDYCDFIVLRGKEEEFFQGLLDFIRNQYTEVEKIQLINIKQDSRSIPFMEKTAPKYDFACTASESEVTPVLSLPSSYEEFLSLMSRKSRHELRRKLRRMERLDQVRTVKFADARGLGVSIKRFIELHRHSDASKEEFWKLKGMGDFFQEVALQFSSQKWVELYFLMHEEDLMAALLNFLYKDKILFYNMAYNRDYAWYSPGLFLFHQRLKEAIKEKKKEADFLRGEEKYKYYFGAKQSRIFNLTLLSRA
jgi:CelD/BcsL family acetyltransferase involved in cellulose biosynthesis